MTDATDTTAPATARLLPWTSLDGKSAFLVGDGTGYVSRIADEIEAEQLSYAAELIDEARGVLDGRGWTSGELQLLAVDLTDALAAVHRIAQSRGMRLVLNPRSADPQGRLKEPESGADLLFRGPEAS